MGIRTPDLLNAIEALYQLSYDPLTNICCDAKQKRDQPKRKKLSGQLEKFQRKFS